MTEEMSGMLFEECRTIRGVRYGRDGLGWIWRENPSAKPGELRWFRTGYSTLQQVENSR